jgi:hypothetical protein
MRPAAAKPVEALPQTDAKVPSHGTSMALATVHSSTCAACGWLNHAARTQLRIEDWGGRRQPLNAVALASSTLRGP